MTSEREAMADIRDRIEAARARATASRPVRYHRDSGHCGRRACPCTHEAPCDHGWLEWPAYVSPETGEVYDTVAPCFVCRPDAAARLEATMRRESADA